MWGNKETPTKQNVEEIFQTMAVPVTMKFLRKVKCYRKTDWLQTVISEKN